MTIFPTPFKRFLNHPTFSFLAKMEGTIIKWVNTKGYGFIGIDDSEKDVFVHYSDVKSDERFISLKVGQRVKFDIENSDKGPKAQNVELL